MAPREKEFDAICLVFDVGSTSTSSGLLKGAVDCAAQLIERKLFSESNDRFGIVLFGTRKALNPLNYPHVTIAAPDEEEEELRPASFDLYGYIVKHVISDERGSTTKTDGDWLDAVVVALNLLKEKTAASSKCKDKKIVLFSDLGCPCSEDKFDLIVKGLEMENVEFTFFGPDWSDEDDDEKEPKPGPSKRSSVDFHKKPKTGVQIANEALVAQMVDRTEGIFCSVEEAMLNLLYKERKRKKSIPWKVTLEIGPDVKIKTSGYIYVRREAPKTWKKCLARSIDENDIYELKPDICFVLDNETQDVVEPDNLIESYKYGSKLITVSEEDKANFEYNAGPKSMSVIGFIQEEQVPRYYLMGDGCMIFKPAEGDENSVVALTALAQGMMELGRVALVRKVYRAGTAPRLGILAPEYRQNSEGDEVISLVYIELPYSEDIRHYYFAPLWSEKDRPSEEQLEAVDELIDSMLLTTKDGEDEFNTETIMNPYYQHLYRCLAYRALNPGKILPDVADYITEMVRAPENIISGSKEALRKIDKLFPRKVVISKKDKITGEKIFAERKQKSENEDEGYDSKVDLSLTSAIVTEVGTTSPVQDFNKLLEQGQDLIAVAQQLEKVIIKLLQTSFGRLMFGKIISCLKVYREACLNKSKPNLYNDFLREFKYILEEEKKVADFWVEIAENNLGLISSKEHPKSKETPEEASRFLTEVETETEKSETPTESKEEDDDMLDEL